MSMVFASVITLITASVPDGLKTIRPFPPLFWVTSCLNRLSYSSYQIFIEEDYIKKQKKPN